jgi:hypothetical protein
LSSQKQILIGFTQYAENNDLDQTTRWFAWNEGTASGLAYTMQEIINPYITSTDVWLNPGASTAVRTYDAAGSCPSTSSPTVVSHYVTMSWAPFNYWDWFGTIMYTGFPTPALSTTVTADGAACTPSWLAARPWARCASFTKADEPSRTAVFIPGALIAYKRPAPAPEAKLKFGSACMVVTGPCHENSTCTPQEKTESKSIQVFRDGANYSFADSSAKWLSSKNFNANSSGIFVYAGVNYPASPFTRVRS